MIEYLYTFQYREVEGDDLELCISHDPTEEHTYASGCKLWPFALSIAMLVLGDKYDIEGLRDYAHTKVDQILRYSDFTPEDLVLAIYYAYQKSQPGDTDGNLSYADNFYDVIKEMPELNEALIRYLMKDR
ncbi:multicopper oxidase abr1 [Physcia stellaris]|nr:multicopper oxidase abr1 [Physcia stellaris]